MLKERRTLVPDAKEVTLDQLMVECNTRLVMVLRATGEAGHCPECRQESQRIHSRYKRKLEKLIKFATRIPAFMYLTDFRENTLQDVITKLEPDLEANQPIKRRWTERL